MALGSVQLDTEKALPSPAPIHHHPPFLTPFHAVSPTTRGITLWIQFNLNFFLTWIVWCKIMAFWKAMCLWYQSHQWFSVVGFSKMQQFLDRVQNYSTFLLLSPITYIVSSYPSNPGPNCEPNSTLYSPLWLSFLIYKRGVIIIPISQTWCEDDSN